MKDLYKHNNKFNQIKVVGVRLHHYKNFSDDFSAHDLSPLILLASYMSLGMIVTLLA
jgi:hypothetical protein